MMRTAAIEWTMVAMRRTGMVTRPPKYCSHIMMPLTISTTISPVIAQKTNFWPALYLPSSGSSSSLPARISPGWDIHSASSRLGRLRRTMRQKSTKKLAKRTTPIHGWRKRAVWPPPKRPVRKNSDGWKKPRPEISRRTRQSAVSQWLARVHGP